MHTKIVEHFKKHDPTLYSYIERVEITEYIKPTNLFARLCDAIISQQLSIKVADVIWARFENLFQNKNVTPESLLQLPDERIRAVGSSWAKVRSLKDLAQKVTDGTVHLEKLDSMSNEEVTTELTKVKGIGPWTAEMFLMFSLGREDLFSHGDLGLRRAIEKVYGFKKEPTKNQIEKIIKHWSPYKTYACRVLWKTLEIKG